MKAWKTLALIGLIIGFGAAAQAEDATNKLVANKLVANKLVANKLVANGSSLGGPGAGAAADIVAIELPNGVRLER